MNTTAKCHLVLGLLAMAAIATASHAAADPAPGNRLRFTIHVRNYAHVKSETLAQAEKTASRIFLKAGVVSEWTDAPVSIQDSDGGAGQRSLGLSQLWVNILPTSMSDRLHLPEGTTGLAPGGGPNRVLAYILYDHVQAMREKQLTQFMRKETGMPVSEPDLLGSVIAHEVGHILLNLDVHSQAGIMRGTWDLSVLTDIVQGALYFTKDQSHVMQAEVARRTALQDALVAPPPSTTPPSAEFAGQEHTALAATISLPAINNFAVNVDSWEPNYVASSTSK